LQSQFYIKLKKIFIFSLILAIAMGLVIAWIDSRPKWDDAGITALMVLAASALCAFLASRRPWLIALAAGIWIPLSGILSSGNFGSLLAIIPAFIGAFIGWFAKDQLKGPKSSKPGTPG